MNLHFRRVVVIVIAWLACGQAASLSAATVVAQGKWQVTIDGVAYPGARAYAGGDLVGEVVDDQLTTGTQKKHVANVQISPLRIEFYTDNSMGLVSLMNEVLANQGATHTVKVSRLNYSLAIIDSIEFPSAGLVGLDLSPWDAASKVTSLVTLTFQPTQVRRTEGKGALAIPGAVVPKPISAASFRFELAGLPNSNVAAVSALTVRRTVIDEVGALRDPAAVSSKLGISNLILEISATDLAGWLSWSDSFLAQGQRTDADEKAGTLTILTPALTPMFSVQLSHVGLVRVSQHMVASSETADRFEVELYVEGASIVNTVAPTSSGSTTSGTSTSAGTNAGTATTPIADTGAAANPVGATNPTTLGNPATITRSPQLTSVPLDNSPLVPTTSSVPLASLARNLPPPGSMSGVVAGDPADQGVRDPRGFPRADGVIRKSYESVDYEASSEETVTYRSKLGIRELIAGYQAVLEKANWELSRKDESGDVANFSYYCSMKWSKAAQACDLRFSQTKLGGTTLTIAVDTRRQGILSAITAGLKDGAKIQPTTEGSPNDVGARDPADFPRISSATRKSYSAYGSSTAPSQEDVVYRAKLSSASVEGFFVNQLSQADWEESVRREGGDQLSGSHEISMNWARGKRAVKITLREIEPAITDITLSLTTSS